MKVSGQLLVCTVGMLVGKLMIILVSAEFIKCRALVKKRERAENMFLFFVFLVEFYI